jgi:hypothetical protein
MRNRRFVLVLLVCALLLLLAQPAYGQVLYGSILGTVEDQSGAVVPNAAITITNNATGLARETQTDESGRYALNNVLDGSYNLTATAAGFRSIARTDVMVTINTVTRIAVRMELGALTEAVTVAASVSVLQTDKSEVRSELTTKASFP